MGSCLASPLAALHRELRRPCDATRRCGGWEMTINSNDSPLALTSFFLSSVNSITVFDESRPDRRAFWRMMPSVALTGQHTARTEDRFSIFFDFSHRTRPRSRKVSSRIVVPAAEATVRSSWNGKRMKSFSYRRLNGSSSHADFTTVIFLVHVRSRPDHYWRHLLHQQ